MKVTFFYRPVINDAHSIETVFETIKSGLSATVVCRDYICTSKWKRLYSFFKASAHQGDINHITGDVHTLALFLHAKKTIITVHDIGRYECGLKGIKKKLAKLLWLTLPLRRVALITTVSEFTRQKLINVCKIPAEKIRLIPNPSKGDFEFCKYNFNEKNPIVLQIGGGNNKNIHRLAQAIKGTNFRILLIRKPDLGVKTMLDNLNIEYQWKSNLSRQEVYECYKKCDIVFFASEYEGFGVPIIEANSVGRPVITSNISSMPDVAGKSAVLVDPFNVEAIKNALLRISSDVSLREKLIAEGLENLKRFSKEAISSQYYNVYKELLKNK